MPLLIHGSGSGSGGGVYVGATAPSNTEMLWIDTANSNVPKYYDGTSWVAIVSVWG